jgi:glycosyltransferase involved in cell wall biosynthesis
VTRPTGRTLSVIVPVYNEEQNAQPLVRGVVEAVRPLGLPFEVVVVDDGSRDATAERLRALLPEVPELVLLRLRRNFGQTLALQAGFDRARGDWIVTMDGDLQNDPADIPRLLEEIERGADVVSGWRRDRKDTLILRKLPSWIANRLIRLVTGVPIHDQGCSLKAYRGDVVRGLDLYADMHRFVAILTMPLGATIREIEVRHHPRVAGQSKYGISRVLKVIADLFGIQMLTRFRDNPLRWFGLLGLPFLGAALLAGAATVAAWPGPIVMPAVTILCTLQLLSCLLYGLLGEVILESAGRARARRVVYHDWSAEA